MKELPLPIKSGQSFVSDLLPSDISALRPLTYWYIHIQNLGSETEPSGAQGIVSETCRDKLDNVPPTKDVRGVR